MSVQKNQRNHIVEYLDYYVSLSTPPNFAIMIRGNWGSGKSWFIKNYFTNHPEIKYLYVSLYGVTSFKEVQEEFYRQMHPVLSSKAARLIGTVAKGLLKASLKIDFYGDKKDDGTISPSIPSIDLAEYIKSLENRVLVFDDLERCSIPIHNTLGFINQFVENEGMKVIVIANEEEIVKRDEMEKSPDSEKYSMIKEKLIGRSFDIEPEIYESINDFVKKIDNDKVQMLLDLNYHTIKEVFNTSGYKNLRHARQAILDFNRFYSYLPKEVDSKIDLIEHIIRMFFALSFELKKGKITEDEIYKIYSSGHTQKLSDIAQKYGIHNLVNQSVHQKSFGDFFKFGLMDKKEVKESILNSRYFEDITKPDWMVLWNFLDLEDDQFEELFNKVYTNFTEIKIDNKYELLHIVGLFLTLINKGLIPIKEEDVIKIGKLNIAELRRKGKLALVKEERFQDDSSYGLGYHGRDMQIFADFMNYMLDEIKLAQSDSLPEAAKLLIIELENLSIENFESMITLRNSPLSQYYDKPVLKSIPEDIFLNAFYRLSNADKRRMAWAIERRYKLYDFSEKLKQELPWLQNIFNAIKKNNDDKVVTVSTLIIKNTVLVCLENAIQSLEK